MLQFVQWESTGKGDEMDQPKYLEGIETIKLKNKGINPLNSYNRIEKWQSVVYSFPKLQSDIK